MISLLLVSCISIYIKSVDSLRFQIPISPIKPIKNGLQNRHFSTVTTDTPPSTTAVPSPPTASSLSLPSHPNLIQRQLENGFTYIILPNKTPADRFEAHLEVLSGSAHELEQQQGMAHLLEHVAYMGSPKRQLISGTGSRTNAYTDFHHTVFFAACPTQTPDQFWKKSMLPMAFDALVDVMTTKVDDDRLEKERAAVLSEMSMVNKMEYRVECQVLSALHNENRISIRFPIGKEELIKSWKKEDVQLYHGMHYRPDNVILYVVGDVDIATTEEVIKQKFGNLSPKAEAVSLLTSSSEYPSTSMKTVYRHFPPVVHRWSVDQQSLDAGLKHAPLLPPLRTPMPLPATDVVLDGKLPKPKTFSHELLQSFSFHLFAKRPIEQIKDEATLRRDLMRRMALSALQIRFNVLQRQDPLFTFIDFNQMNWPREGCAVCSLDLTTDASCWKEAIAMAVKEIRRLGVFGLTDSELPRYKQAVLSEAEQQAATVDQMSNEDVLESLMEAEANGHTYMHPNDRLRIIKQTLDSITIEETNAVARELCEHLSHLSATSGVMPSAIVACFPMMDRNREPFTVTEEEVANVIASALELPLEALDNLIVPETLLKAEDIKAKVKGNMPTWIASEPKTTTGVVQKTLNNGLKVNLHSLKTEPQRTNVRIYVPGGRMMEEVGKEGAVALGCRTMQEGGAFSGATREEVELFCIDHQVMVDIIAEDDCLIFDFQSVTTPGPGGKVTGLEAVLQVAHIILTDFKWEADAFERAKQGLHEKYDSVVKGLETACVERITASITDNDGRFTTPTHTEIEALSLEEVKDAVLSQLRSDNVEVSISGDAPIALMEQLCLTYLGSVPMAEGDPFTFENETLSAKVLGNSEQIGVFLPDNDERAMGYLAGASANAWGVFADGTTVADAVTVLGGKKDIEARRQHPLFGALLLQVIEEVANRRLFSVVREERRLTYDASFSFQGKDNMKGGWYLVSVTSSPSQVLEAVRACKEALRSLRGPFGVMGDSVQSAKRSILNRFRTEMLTNKFWVENMCGTQLESTPLKSLKCLTDFESVLGSITVQDAQLLVEKLGFLDEDLTACVGITSPTPPSQLSN